MKLFALIGILGIVSEFAHVSAQQTLFPGALYTSDNQADGNNIVIYDRATDGTLSFKKLVASGGLGSGDGLGNQSAVVLSTDQRFLFAVNAGSNELSVFRVLENDLQLVDVMPTFGIRPVSVDEHDGIVYVLNAGSDTVVGFQQTFGGQLAPIPGGRARLSGSGTAAAQVGFSPKGDHLYVTERATNIISHFTLDPGGRVSSVERIPSNGQTPFGFAFGQRSQLIVSEAFGGAAGASATSSYALTASGSLSSITASLGAGQSANCWIAVTGDGRFAVASNTGSDSLTTFTVGFQGQLSVLASGTPTSDRPLDMGFTGDGQYLYVLSAGPTSGTDGTFDAFRVDTQGQLLPLGSLPAGLPGFASGLAVR